MYNDLQASPVYLQWQTFSWAPLLFVVSPRDHYEVEIPWTAIGARWSEPVSEQELQSRSGGVCLVSQLPEQRRTWQYRCWPRSTILSRIMIQFGTWDWVNCSLRSCVITWLWVTPTYRLVASFQLEEDSRESSWERQSWTKVPRSQELLSPQIRMARRTLTMLIEKKEKKWSLILWNSKKSRAHLQSKFLRRNILKLVKF